MVLEAKMPQMKPEVVEPLVSEAHGRIRHRARGHILEDRGHLMAGLELEA